MVVLVGDDADTIDTYAAYLESHGIWVAKAAPTVAGVHDVEALQPDVVLMDLGPPSRGDEARFLRIVRHASQIRDTPAILLTCSTAQAAEIATGREVCLLKPVSPTTLLERIQSIVGRKRAAAVSGVDGDAGYCPACGHALQPVQRPVVVGSQRLHYFKPCARGCGLFCLNASTNTWTQLT